MTIVMLSLKTSTMASKAISARIKEATYGMLLMERANGIKSNTAINDALSMYLEFLDAVRESRCHPDDAGAIIDMFIAKWKTKIVYTIHPNYGQQDLLFPSR